MGLISREAALEAVKIPNGEYPNPSERHGIIIARVEARRRIMEIPSVPAVPLDNLCEFLGKATHPCILLAIGCPYDESNCEECDSCNAWKAALTKWMEEQNA